MTPNITAEVFSDPCSSTNDKLDAIGWLVLGVVDSTPGNVGKKIVKPSLSAHKKAMKKVHEEVGKLPKGRPGKFDSPQAGDSKKGYRLDPPHDGVAKGDAESKYHINWWDYSAGKRGKGGRSGAIPIED